VAKDNVRAAQWYRKAAEQNFAQSQLHLGVCYDTGRGVTKDEADAVTWYIRAAEQDHAEAQYNLGVCYLNGQIVSRDDSKAVDWYTRAASINRRPCENANSHHFDSGLTAAALRVSTSQEMKAKPPAAVAIPAKPGAAPASSHEDKMLALNYFRSA